LTIDNFDDCVRGVCSLCSLVSVRFAHWCLLAEARGYHGIVVSALRAGVY